MDRRRLAHHRLEQPMGHVSQTAVRLSPNTELPLHDGDPAADQPMDGSPSGR